DFLFHGGASGAERGAQHSSGHDSHEPSLGRAEYGFDSRFAVLDLSASDRPEFPWTAAVRRQGTTERKRKERKITRWTAPCSTVARPPTRVTALISNVIASNAVSFADNPKASRCPSTIAAAATAGMVRPMLASAEPSAR